MKQIEYLVIDCTMGISTILAGQVNDWYIRPKRKKGRGQAIGSFHWLIESSGNSVNLYDDDVELPNPKAHNIPLGSEAISISPHNSVVIGWIGGNDSNGTTLDNRTTAQNTRLLILISQYITVYPQIIVVGKNQIQSGLESPCFFVPTFLTSSNIPYQNVYSHDSFSYLTRVRQTAFGLYDEDWFLRNRSKRFVSEIDFVGMEWKMVHHGLNLKNSDDLIMGFFHDGIPAMTRYEIISINSVRIQTAVTCTLQVNVLGLS